MGILNLIFGLGKDLVDRILPNPEDELKRQTLLLGFQQACMEKQADLEMAAADIVKTEAASGHWLTSNWRPMIMVVFAGLIVARFFGVNNPNMSPSEYEHLWTLLELGIGGYIGGRSAEKIASMFTAPGASTPVQKKAGE